MSDLGKSVSTVFALDELAKKDVWINRIHPLAKLVITLLYIMTVVSFSKYNLTGLLGMAIYPIVLFVVGELSVYDCLKRFKIVLPLIFIISIINPFFDRSIIMYVGRQPVSGGVISMITIILKGIFTVMAGYILIATTSIEQIGHSLCKIHFPKIIVTLILLIYRYITVLFGEADTLTMSYRLRAPGQKGINIRAWGPFVGQLLLRSIDKAQTIYESMMLRGYTGDIIPGTEVKFTSKCLIYMIIWSLYLIFFRVFPVFEIIGQIL